MLPFEKKKEGSAALRVDEHQMRKPDEEEEYGMLDALAEDFLEAIERKDRRLMVQALSAYCDYVMSEMQISPDYE